MAELPENDVAPAPLEYAPVSTPAVTLRSFYSALDAQIHANALAEAGIAYNLLGGNTNSLGPYNAFTQVDLQVQQRDRDEADRVLKQLEATASAPEGELDVELSDAMNESDEPRCPQCASWRTYEVPAPWPGLMNYLLARAPDRPRQLECLKCHYRWVAGAADELKPE